MAIVTTKSLQDKPITPLDWTGQPLKEGASYWGESRPDEGDKDAPPSPVKASPTRRKRRFAIMSPEQREKARERMRRYWAKKRGIDPGRTESSNPATSDAPTLGESG